MIRFCRSGTATAPISTPRSPRATITASASRRMSSSTATASAFSIFAITCAVEPDASISVLQRLDVRRGADERERDEVAAELERELEVVDVLLRQRRDRERDSGEVDALVRADRAGDDHFADGATTLDRGRPGASPRRRRSGRRSRAGGRSRARQVRSGGRRPARRPRPRSSPRRRASGSGLRQFSDPELDLCRSAINATGLPVCAAMARIAFAGPRGPRGCRARS